MPNPELAVTGATIKATEYGNAVRSRLEMVYATTELADADNPTPEQGQRRLVTAPMVEQMWWGEQWVTVRQVFGGYGWRDPWASWGQIARQWANVPDVASTDVMVLTNNTRQTVAGYSFGDLSVETVQSRRYAIEGLIRVDGGALSDDGTIEIYVTRVSPAGPTDLLGPILNQVPQLDTYGGGASAVWSYRYDDVTVTTGTAVYRLGVRRRIPLNSEPMRVRAPVTMSITDVGPINQIP